MQSTTIIHCVKTWHGMGNREGTLSTQTGIAITGTWKHTVMDYYYLGLFCALFFLCIYPIKMIYSPSGVSRQKKPHRVKIQCSLGIPLFPSSRPKIHSFLCGQSAIEYHKSQIRYTTGHRVRSTAIRLTNWLGFSTLTTHESEPTAI